MYPPPDIVIYHALLQRGVESICFGLSAVSIAFEGNHNLNFVSCFRFGNRENVLTLPVENFPIKVSGMMSIINSVVTAVRCDSDGTLDLDFSSNGVLIIYANNPMYEAYSLRIDGNTFIV